MNNMEQTTLSHMQTKGWHCDVTDLQIERAIRAIKALVGELMTVYYTEDPDPYTGKRYFWTSVGWEEAQEVGAFDPYGNLIIYSTTLTTGT